MIKILHRRYHNSGIMCLHIGTHKNHRFSFGTNRKLMVLGVLILVHIMCLHIGTHKNHRFSFGTNGKLMVLGVLILVHIIV